MEARLSVLQQWRDQETCTSGHILAARPLIVPDGSKGGGVLGGIDLVHYNSYPRYAVFWVQMIDLDAEAKTEKFETKKIELKVKEVRRR